MFSNLKYPDIRSNLGSNLDILVKKSTLDLRVATRHKVRMALARTGQVEVPAQDVCSLQGSRNVAAVATRTPDSLIFGRQFEAKQCIYREKKKLFFDIKACFAG